MTLARRQELQLDAETQQRVYRYDPAELHGDKSRLPEPDHPLIYEQGWSASVAQKATSLGLGALFWLAWLTLWAPLGTFLLWTFAPTWGLGTVMDHQEDSLPLMALITCFGVALSSLLVLSGVWQWSSRAGQRAVSRRKDVTVQELAQSHHVDLELLRSAWSSRRMVVHHDDKGHVTDVETSLPMQTSANSPSKP